MPLDIERFERGETGREQPTSVRILRFLLENDDAAHTRGEIADAIDANPETVGTNLTRLKERGLVRHREPYWACAEDRDAVIEELRDRADGGSFEDVLYGEISAEQERSSSGTGESSRLHRNAASAYFERVRDRLGDAVEDLYLFGSVARDAADADSDVDVLAVVADDADFATVDDRLLEIAYDVQLDTGVRIEVHSMRASEFATRKQRGDPFVRAVVDAGVTDA